MDFHDSFSSWSHFLTAAWALFAWLFLDRFTRGHGSGRWACGVYMASMVVLYTASGLFHGVWHDTPESRLFYQKLDKSAVFLFVAGSYTPVFWYLLRPASRAVYVGVVWGLGLFGVVALWTMPDLPYEALLGVYTVMASIGLFPTLQYVRVFGPKALLWVYGAFGTYLVGGVLDVAQTPVLVPGLVGPHEILHLTDTIATMINFGFIVLIVLRFRPAELKYLPVRTIKRVVRRRRRRSMNESKQSKSPVSL